MKCHICSHIYIIETLSGAYAGILKGGSILLMRANFFGPAHFWGDHAHFYSIYGNSDHQYGKWSTFGVRYLKV